MHKIWQITRKLLAMVNLVFFWEMISIITFFCTKYIYLQPYSEYEFEFPILSFIFLCLLLVLSVINIFFGKIIENKWLGVIGKIGYFSVGILFTILVIQDFILFFDLGKSCNIGHCIYYPPTLLGYTYGFFNTPHLLGYTLTVISLNLAILPLTIIFVLFVFMIYRYYRFQKKKNPFMIKSEGIRFLDQSVLLYLVLFLLTYLWVFNLNQLFVSTCVVIVLAFSTYNMISIYARKFPRILSSEALIRWISTILAILLMVVSYLALFNPTFETRPPSAADWFSCLLYTRLHIYLISILAITNVVIIVLVHNRRRRESVKV